MKNIKIIPFTKENEDQKNDGIAPSSVIYCGSIGEMKPEDFKNIDCTKEEFSSRLPDELTPDDHVLVVGLQYYFEEAVKPLMKYLAENHHPHSSVYVTSNQCVLLTSEMCFNTDEFLID